MIITVAQRIKAFVLCVKTDLTVGPVIFEFEGCNYAAIAINPNLDETRSFKTNGELIAAVEFFTAKRFKSLTANDPHNFIAWVN